MSAAGDHREFTAFARRVLRALARRVAVSDVEDLTELVELRVEVDRALDVAVAGLREAGASWTEIGRGLGISKQAARQRFVDKVGLS